MSDAPFTWGGLRWWWQRHVRTNIPPGWYVVFAAYMLLSHWPWEWRRRR